VLSIFYILFLAVSPCLWLLQFQRVLLSYWVSCSPDSRGCIENRATTPPRRPESTKTDLPVIEPEQHQQQSSSLQRRFSPSAGSAQEEGEKRRGSTAIRAHRSLTRTRLLFIVLPSAPDVAPPWHQKISRTFRSEEGA